MSSLASLMRAERATRAHIKREIKSAKKYQKKKGLWCAFVDFHTS